MNLELFLSLRYFLVKKRRSSISLISFISIACVALSVMVLIVVFSVFNGFRQEMRGKILAIESHVVLSPYRTTVLRNYSGLLDEIRALDGIKAAFPYIDGQGMIRYRNAVNGIQIQGVMENVLEVDTEFSENFEVISGSFDLSGRNSILIGEVLSQQTGIGAGDLVSLHVVEEGGMDDLLLPLNIQYRVAGVFRTDYAKYDQFYVFMSLRNAQTLYGHGDGVTSIGIKVDNAERADFYRRQVYDLTQGRYSVESWMSLNRNLHAAMSNEKVLIAIVLSMLVAMAAFAMASTLIMVVMEKEREIGILKSIGMAPSSVMRVFLIQGFLVGIVGALIGLFLGLFVASSLDTLLTHVEDFINGFNALYFNIFGSAFDLPVPMEWRLFPADVYYVTTFPVLMEFWEIFFISLGSVLLTTLCAFIPAKQASRLKVTEVLHKE